jgi:Flp pilus assembly protein TadD
MDSDRNLEAAREFAKAAELKPDDYESVFNAGVAFRQAGNNIQAETFYRKAVNLKPEVSRCVKKLCLI